MCVYEISEQKNGEINFLIIALYVDDILVFSKNTEMLKKQILALPNLSMTQTKYLEGILKRFDMHNCKPVATRTPLEQGRKFEPLSEEEEPIDIQPYQMAIGCAFLTYPTSASRPDSLSCCC